MDFWKWLCLLLPWHTEHDESNTASCEQLAPHETTKAMYLDFWKWSLQTCLDPIKGFGDH